MNQRLLVLCFGILLFAGHGVSHGAGDPEAGKAKATACAACHGQEGISMVPIYPNLACQKEQYLADSIKAYQSGDRNNAIMKPMVAALTDEDVANLAAYFSTLGCK
jgi:cytochrome c553